MVCQILSSFFHDGRRRKRRRKRKRRKVGKRRRRKRRRSKNEEGGGEGGERLRNKLHQTRLDMHLVYSAHFRPISSLITCSNLYNNLT